MAATLVAFIAVRLVFSQLIRPHLMTPLRATFTLLATVNGYASFNGSTSNLTAGSPSDASLQNAWIYSARIVDAAGRALTPQATASACPQLANGGLRAQLPPAGSAGHVHAVPTQAAGQALQQCVTKLSDSYHTILSYQPANRYWTFQALETAIFAALAICLAGVALCLYLMTGLDGRTWLRFVVWFAAGMAIYAAYGFRHSLLRPRGGAQA